jgi:hypothetical protein
VAHAQNLTIRGIPGYTKLIVASPRSGFLVVQQSKNVLLAGFDIDYETPPFSQGQIIGVDSRSITYVVDPGFPEPSHPIFSKDLFGTPGTHRIGFVHQGASFIMKGAPASYLSIEMPTSRGNRTWKVGVSGMFAPASVGDGFSMGPRSSPGMLFYQNTNITLKDISIFTAPSLGIALIANRGSITLDHLSVKIPPGSGRRLSVVADAIHAQNNAAQIIVRDSYFEGMGDDVFNTYATGQTITAVSGNQIVIHRSNLDYEVGNTIQITDPSRSLARFGPGGEATVTQVTHKNGETRLTLNKNVSQAVRRGDIAFNVHHAAPRSILFNNHFGSFRGMIRIRSVVSQIRGNHFVDPRNARILFSIEHPWNEGPMVNKPYHANNTVRGGTLSFIP